MNQNLLINCIPLRIKEEEVIIYWSESPQDDFLKASKSSITLNQDHRSTLIYWNHVPDESMESITINSTDHKRIFRNYLNEKLFAFFRDKNLPRCRSFLGGTDIWLKQDSISDRGENIYKVFRVRVLAPMDQYATKGWSILLSYKGEHKTVLRSHDHIEIPENIIKTFVNGENVERKSKWEGDLPDDIEVVVNRDITKVLGFDFHYYRETNKYLTHYSQITGFYNDFLKGEMIDNVAYVLESGFGEIVDSQIWSTSVETNVLEFGKNRTHFNAYIGLKEYGPLSGPSVSSYKFFYIFHENDRDHANKLYQFFNRGLKGYPGLKSFVDVNLSLDKDKTITFSNDEYPSGEILEKLENIKFDSDCYYIAIYLSPINRDLADERKHAQYYQIKEALLSKNVASQVIYRENIDKPNFNFFLPNISIAILAKLGGRPWRLSRVIKDELVIGVGAYRQNESRYLGTTFSFRNDGTFIGFDATNSSNIEALGVFFENAINSFIADTSTVKRVIIHFFKKMNRDEEKQLNYAFDRLNIQVPYFVLNITKGEAHEYLVIDDKYNGKMPVSGTCVKLRNGEFLLCNNTRYQVRTGARIDDFPFPLKISISKSNLNDLDDDVIRDLIDQVYQFSRMYWRSVKQRALPVTILYSEMIAAITANLPNRTVPNTDVAKNTLWFL